MRLAFPQSAFLQGRDHVALVAPGMTAHQHLAVSVSDGEAGLAVVMSWAARHPGLSDLAATKRPSDGFSGHRKPPHRKRLSRHRCYWLGRTYLPATTRPGRQKSQ